MDIAGILFDMDGVLVDSEPVITEAAIRALRQYGVEAKEVDFKPFTGMGEVRFIGGVAEKYGKPFVPEMKTLTYEIYGQIVDEHLKVYAGTLDALRALSGYRLALASSADLVKVRHNLRVAHIPFATFAAIVTAEDVARKKPDPAIFLTAAEKLGLPASRCLAIDDAISGVQAGKAAGCYTVGVTTSFPAETLLEAGADCVIAEIGELPALLH
ncbi:MAG TPA: HAD-IA family hydrolase [Candidatus Alectryocaccomicrobium excrementavium]|uniref:HAD-IA family hydrolase n=1 Tax=Candidatus Alectryocaccomicrobium excrementavium TaxID=2840668 RepID=A0A9D1K664_9FIRM|nr:HAD-IA family hydrolase [Candidatus Alectryocaccomicrobium excrementavium]